MLCTFLLFKASAFLQIFFPRKFTFPTSFENVSFSQLKLSNKRTKIPLLINQFVSLIELKIKRLINYWANTCKFKIAKITYSKSRTTYDVSKNKPLSLIQLLVSSRVTFNQQFCRWRCFSFYWFGKPEFGKFTNGIPVIRSPVLYHQKGMRHK